GVFMNDEPTPILKIFNMKVQTCLLDVTSLVEVHGIVAIQNPLDVSLTDGYLCLLSPRRGMSMEFNCLSEVDIRMKATGDDDTDDQTLADGCMNTLRLRKLSIITLNVNGSDKQAVIYIQFGNFHSLI
uniref:Uncharacterized protein n=1 Tax=Setaria italica TaxID=4555 RepID=K4AM79_SETIT